jgi:hypothetical protein
MSRLEAALTESDKVVGIRRVAVVSNRPKGYGLLRTQGVTELTSDAVARNRHDAIFSSFEGIVKTGLHTVVTPCAPILVDHCHFAREFIGLFIGK